jgi:hypothetical protein
MKNILENYRPQSGIISLGLYEKPVPSFPLILRNSLNSFLGNDELTPDRYVKRIIIGKTRKA